MKRVNIAIVTMPNGAVSARTDMPPRMAIEYDSPPLTGALRLARLMMLNAHYLQPTAVLYGPASVPLVQLAGELLGPQYAHLPEIQARVRTALGLPPLDSNGVELPHPESINAA
jgi:hypothetical protein